MRQGKTWTAGVSWRFLTGRRGGRGRLLFLFSVLLIASGVATLNTILAVMNGMQQGFIRSILEIGSHHLQWHPRLGADEGDFPLGEVLDIFENHPQVILAAPFREGQTMLSGWNPKPSGALIRGVPPSYYSDDGNLAERLRITAGRFSVSGRGIVLGNELALSLGVLPGDQVRALDLGGVGLSPLELTLEVTGLFECDYREYESAMAFVSLESAAEIFGSTMPDIGVKLIRPEFDKTVAADLAPALTEWEGQLTTWRENNRAFFGALRMEKVMMLLLLALIFVVVAVNIDHALRRMATERVEDLAILKAVGASPGGIRRIFLYHGLIVGGLGGILGSALGVGVGANVDAVIGGLRWVGGRLGVSNNAVSLNRSLVESYFRNSEVIAGDVLIIVFLAAALSFLAAVRAASMAARLNPSEVLRSE